MASALMSKLNQRGYLVIVKDREDCLSEDVGYVFL
jgi:hypothetical protein